MSGGTVFLTATPLLSKNWLVWFCLEQTSSLSGRDDDEWTVYGLLWTAATRTHTKNHLNSLGLMVKEGGLGSGRSQAQVLQLLHGLLAPAHYGDVTFRCVHWCAVSQWQVILFDFIIRLKEFIIYLLRMTLIITITSLIYKWPSDVVFYLSTAHCLQFLQSLLIVWSSIFTCSKLK